MDRNFNSKRSLPHLSRSRQPGDVVIMEQQGRLGRFRRPQWGKRAPGGRRGKRGRVASFGRQHVGRMRAAIATLDVKWLADLIERRQVVFGSVTYGGESWPSPWEAKAHRLAFERRMNRRYPECGAVWRMAPQKRGAPHFHWMFFGRWFARCDEDGADTGPDHFRQLWRDTIGWDGVDGPDTWIVAVRTFGGVVSYLGRYLAKVDVPSAEEQAAVEESRREGAAAGGLCISLNGSYHDVDGGRYAYSGREWGIVGKCHLKFGDRRVVAYEDGDWYDAWVRQVTANVWKGAARGRLYGGDVFLDEPRVLERMADNLGARKLGVADGDAWESEATVEDAEDIFGK